MSTTTTTTPLKPQPQPQWLRALKTAALFLLHQWLLIGIGVACVLAYYFPNVAKSGGTIRSEYSILYGAMALIFLISGLSVPREKLLLHLLNYRLHILVQAFSFLFIPAFILAIVHIILVADPHQHIDRALLAGYIFLACIPTTIASNVVMTRSAGGDDAAALVEVIIANFLGPFVTAGWTVTLLPKEAGFDVWRVGDGDLGSMYRDVFKQLGLAVLLPLVVGQLVRWLWTDRVAWVLNKYKVPKISTACLILLVWSTFSSCFATGALQSLSASSIIFVVLFNIALYMFLTVACFCFARPPPILARMSVTMKGTTLRPFDQLNPYETIAVCFCGPAKSTALGIPLLYAMWSSLDLYVKSKTSVPVLLYTTEQICVAHFFVYGFGWWRTLYDMQPDRLI
ncbi:sodium bile acid transporter family protein [Aspergillus heteromorphus CBS 117.55]|uniref:Sodium bile acid transporter family protein n=1 Tax=Aspergillus heteromorphus CBS 117.55 TaxID=1448321 RepID=A0A317V565_9EURO|nr:sodium bile acid transporter family protein [Aspergillus heteromorphus CBS 117.55]PWY69146.1 sodium bile acid transporter family protein [Aspergillus heteromorphus CBS 117.55]